MKITVLSLLVVALTSTAFAGPTVAPEIDGSTATAAIALLAGGLVVLRARRRK